MTCKPDRRSSGGQTGAPGRSCKAGLLCPAEWHMSTLLPLLFSFMYYVGLLSGQGGAGKELITACKLQEEKCTGSLPCRRPPTLQAPAWELWRLLPWQGASLGVAAAWL